MIRKNLINCLIIVLLLFLCTTIVVPVTGNDSSVANGNAACYWNGNLTVDVKKWVDPIDRIIDGLSVTYYDKDMKILHSQVIQPEKHHWIKIPHGVAKNGKSSIPSSVYTQYIYFVSFDRWQGISWIDICLSVKVSGFCRKAQLHKHVARYNATQLMNHDIYLGTAQTDRSDKSFARDNTEVRWKDNGVGPYTTWIKGKGGGKCTKQSTITIEKGV